MKYLYHIVPEKMFGNVLFPLSKLKKLDSTIYKLNMKKYLEDGRKDYLDNIPFLNCNWTEVINLISANPKRIFNLLKKEGNRKIKPIRWYKIPLSRLKGDKVVYLYREDLLSKENYNKKENYELFDNSRYKVYSKIPISLKNYYRECYSKEEIPLIFHTIPHILYKGEIDVSNLEIIETK